MIDIKDLHFAYRRGEEVLKGISFSAEDNSVVSILGPNGTGKTTFLKCMCGLHRPTSGTAEVDGIDVFKLKGRDMAKKIGFVPQSVPVSRMSVFDTVLTGRKPYIDWAASSEDLDKVSEVLESLGMGHLALKYMDQISGGEFQKAQIARALVQEPSVLILDEPTNNLDIANQHRTMKMVTEAVRTRGMCTVMTMHDINLAAHFSDKFLFLKDGEVAAYGGPEVITEDIVKEVYGFEAEITEHRGVPVVLPGCSEKYLDRFYKNGLQAVPFLKLLRGYRLTEPAPIHNSSKLNPDTLKTP